MNRRDEDSEQVLDQVLAEIRGNAQDARTEQTVVDRVWGKISREITAQAPEQAPSTQPIRGCAGFQGLIPEHLGGRLSGGTRLLFLDHVNECVPCRRALKDAKSRGGAIQTDRRVTGKTGWMGRTAWRLAAAAVIALALVGVSFKSKALSFKSGGLIHIEAAEGEVLRIGRTGSVPLAPGDSVTLNDGEVLRTGRDSTAVLRLGDQSRVEMRQRSQLAVQEQRYLLPGLRADGVLGLERGGIIVEASNQGSGHLFVDTNDCRVAVTGTVFSVSHGTKGSRVSVVEGEVHVKQAGAESILHPGDQTATSAAILPVPVEQDIAWSRNSRQYVELLREVRALSREIDAVLRPGLRHETDLLDLAPENTVVWVGVPNLSDQLSDAFQILQERMVANELLRDWWEHKVAASGELERAMDKIRTYGQYLGPELVVSLSHGPDGELGAPLVFARLLHPAALREALQGEIEAIQGAHPDVHLQLLEGPLPGTTPSAGPNALLFWVEGDIVAASPSLDRLRGLQAAVRRGAPQDGAFHQRLAETYSDGVEWVVGVDLEHLMTHDQPGGPLERLGLLDVQHLIAEREQLDDHTTQNRVVLTFSQPRHHVAAWLADPAPMGALDYVGPDANFAAAVVIKEPDELVAELFSILSQTDTGFAAALARFEAENHVDVRRDFAAPLGGEIAVALDGPMLPSPSWKLVLEVYDPVRLEHTIEWIVEKLHAQAVAAGRAGFRLDRETNDGREFFKIVSLDTGLELSYLFDQGYLVAAPSRGLLERALQTRRSGISLPDSPGFTRLLPADGHDDFSGVLYHNLKGVLGPLSSLIHGVTTESTSPEQVQLVQALGDESLPGVLLLYGEDRQIALTGINEGGLLGSGLGSLSGFSGLLGVQQSLMQTTAAEAETDH